MHTLYNTQILAYIIHSIQPYNPGAGLFDDIVTWAKINKKHELITTISDLVSIDMDDDNIIALFGEASSHDMFRLLDRIMVVHTDVIRASYLAASTTIHRIASAGPSKLLHWYERNLPDVFIVGGGSLIYGALYHKKYSWVETLLCDSRILENLFRPGNIIYAGCEDQRKEYRPKWYAARHLQFTPMREELCAFHYAKGQRMHT